MRFLIRWSQRIAVAVIAITVAWFIIFPIFNRLDQRLPLLVAIMMTYYISAYIILPKIVHFVLLILRKGRIPRFTRGNDGLLVDPVNIILVGTKEDLIKAFEKIGWDKADKLSINSSIKMIERFIDNRSYPNAPFSSLFLFGKRQDIGFQQSIGNSPRKRHHIRFWAINTDKEIDPFDLNFWTKKRRIKPDKICTWMGAGSEDVGFAFTLTYQLSHRVDPEVDKERKYILDLLKKSKQIGKVTYYKPGNFKVGKYISDGRIAVAKLKS